MESSLNRQSGVEQHSDTSDGQGIGLAKGSSSISGGMFEFELFDLLKLCLLAYFVYAIATSFFNKGKVKPRFNSNNRDRLYKRLMHSSYDVIADLEPDDKELFKTTFENTVVNAQRVQLIKEPIPPKSHSRRVSFHSNVKPL